MASSAATYETSWHAEAGGPDAAAVAAFCRRPASYVHADHLRACLPDLPVPLAGRMLACGRLHDELSRLLVAQLRLEPCGAADFADPASRLALLDAVELRRVGDLAGGIWHAQSLRAIILGRARAAILSAFEPRLYDTAMDSIDLSPAPRQPLDPAALAAAIQHDGSLCLAAFVAGLPAPLRSRVVLKFPKASPIGTPVTGRQAELGPIIVGRIAAQELAS